MGFFLQRHEEFINRRGIYNEQHVVSGLCDGLKITNDRHMKIFDLLRPYYEVGDFNDVQNVLWWGSGDNHARPGVYTELRETIVLFCAALNNEL